MIILIIIILILFSFTYHYRKCFLETKFQKRSLSTKYGKMTEQFFPFMENYPYNENNFRFIGNPIDGIQFEDDKIIFIEFKIANGRLSLKQKNIKELIQNGKVEFKEFKI